MGRQQEYGTVNAVYTFLQDYLDVHWLWPEELGEDIVKRQTIAFEPFERSYHPQVHGRSALLYYSELLGGGFWNSKNQLRESGVVLQADSEPKTLVTPGKAHRMVVQNDGGHLSMFVDGQLILEHRERRAIADAGHDRVGFYFYTAAKVSHAKVYVKRLEGEWDLERSPCSGGGAMAAGRFTDVSDHPCSSVSMGRNRFCPRWPSQSWPQQRSGVDWILSCAVKTWSGLLSRPNHFRPSLFAATQVVPVLTNGSRTRSLRLVYSLISLLGISSGKTREWSVSTAGAGTVQILASSCASSSSLNSLSLLTDTPSCFEKTSMCLWISLISEELAVSGFLSPADGSPEAGMTHMIVLWLCQPHWSS